MARMRFHHLLSLLVASVLVGGAMGFSDLPNFPEPPTALIQLTQTEQTDHALSPLDLAEPQAAEALVELDSTQELPPSDVAIAAILPSAASNPLTAALAIEVPDPHTFLKDDVFLQQLEREHIQAEQAEALENGVATETEGFFDDLISDRPLQPPPRRNRNASHRRRRPSTKSERKDDDVASLTDLYNNRPHAKKAGPFLSKKGGIFQGHQRGAASKRFPETDQAPHQEAIPRTFRTANGHFEKNLAFRDLNSPVDSPFPHHGGHVAAPHNKGRKNAHANLPKKPLSRHILAQKKGSKTNRFPKAKSFRKQRAAARRRAAKKRADFLAGKRRLRHRKNKKSKARKGKGLNGAKKAKKGKKGALKGKKSKKSRKGRKGKKGKHASKHGKGKNSVGKGKRGKHGKHHRHHRHHRHHGRHSHHKHHHHKGQKGSSKGQPGKQPQQKGGKGGKHHHHHHRHHNQPGQKNQPQPQHKHHHKKKDNSIIGGVGKLLHQGTKKLATKLEQKSNQVFNKAEKSVHKGITNVADKLKDKVKGWGGLGELLTKGINKLQDSAHKGVDKARNSIQGDVNGLIKDAKKGVDNSINTSVQRAKNALKNRFGGFFTMAELKAEIAAQRRGGIATPHTAPPTSFGSGFEHIQEARADMRADVQRFKDVEFAATKAAADLEKLTAEHAKREAVLQHHIDAKFKAHSNLHTMFGASNGVFDRLPTHPSQGRIRGSPARRSYTPARRIVPVRLARLEDQRMQARRRTYARGMMADRYHQQLHGENLGVFAGPGEYTQPDAFLQMGEDSAVHDA